ncbi:MAG: carbohydrate kinase [Lachnospiraceae bacterium]|nr:carbohydrate kinase [Lachnospiraceae bacterium]
MKTLYAIGEMLIDFTAQETGLLSSGFTFRKNAGGAPANVAVCVAKLGGKANVITKLGKDGFGAFLEDTLRKEGVGTDYVFTTDEANTALAFVSRDANGERDFTFYRNPSADMLLNKGEVQSIPFEEGDILHFGSVDLCDAPVKEAHKVAIESAREAGAIISFDPNLRYSLWESATELLNTVRSFLPLADILKVSEEELYDITGINDEEAAAKSLFRGHVQVIFVTKGGDGAAVYTKELYASASVDKTSPVVDTTGAGDSFIGTVLYQILERGGIEEFTESELTTILERANRAATYVVAHEGAIPAMPIKKSVF